VSLTKLTSQLRRDIAASPQKAAALGLMVLVALYFWAPLIWRWLPARGEGNGKVDMSKLVLTDEPAAKSASSALRTPAFRWEKVRQLVREDARMKPAAFDAAWHDPFGKPAPKPVSAEAEPVPVTAQAPVAETEAAPEPDLTAASLVLGGILIGPRRKVATINGEPCHEGDSLTVTDANGKSVQHQVRIVRITRRQVDLESKGHTLTLELAAPRLSQGDWLTPAGPRRNGR
jgi:hypothetical protein